ncbi:LmeA family phospholipid-binding protein [uncultured Arthrobacter sp.]|uniref:LmeA family phospholipid-binding protein n=1 Tax=uncultured Arthrobacter sp. TaxID=114050 RepID=UPI00262B6051|nr:LmeA family phospholipid-binding protein [uncultured Arthrobacter sp.]
MEWTRAKDWLIGAAGLLVVLVVVLTVAWFVISDPVGRSGPGATPSPSSEGPVDAGPPDGLAEDDVWLADVVLEVGTAVSGGTTLRDIDAVGRDVLTGPDGLVAGGLELDATVPFDVVAEELGGGALVRAGDDGEAEVVRGVEVLGREVRVVASGTVEVDAGRLVVEPRSIDLGGPGFLSDALAAVARRAVTIEHDIEGLPEGLVLQDVSVGDDGFRATFRGEDVVLTR